MEIVTIKGFGSGLGALMIAVCVGSEFPTLQHIAIILLLGYVAYGLSIYFYTYAQRTIGAAKDQYLLCPGTIYRCIVVYLIVRRTCHHDIHNCLNPNGCWIAAK